MEKQNAPYPLNKETLLSHSFINVWENLQHGVIITDSNAVCLYMNTAQKKFDNFEGIDVVGKSITELYAKTDLEMIKTCIKNGKPVFNRPAHYATRGNMMVHSIVSVFPLMNGDAVNGALSFAVDIRTMQKIFNDAIKTTQHIKEIKDNQKPYKELFTFDRIIGNDTGFLNTIKMAKAAGKSDVHVMIWGESGSGKELFAQAVHCHGELKSKPFIPINCAAIPDHLLEGILFGTSKGAFTGAMDKAGLFEVAHGGTLFLDELNSMQLNLQAKILRAIQEKKIRRVGSLKEKRIDVRIISALNISPTLAMKENILREDLFYRLAIVMLKIPPLRRRKLDIVFLSQFFLKKHGTLPNHDNISISDEVYGLFLKYGWKGNVRELEHTIEGAIHMLNKGNVIYKRHLSPYFLENYKMEMEQIEARQKEAPPEKGLSGLTNSGIKKLSDLKHLYQQAEIDCIKKSLVRAEGNIAKAARSLGISPPNLHYKLRILNLAVKDLL